MSPRLTVSVQHGDIDVAAALSTLETLGGGAVASFTGIVRDDRATLSVLELETYPAMARRALEDIARSALDRWPLLGVTMIHRYGELPVGARIVLVAAASNHRAAALDACAYLIDWAKTQAPFWKKEHLRDGSCNWVEARDSDAQAAAAWVS